jgi:diguanylate cyclase (GGDEF)-like protein
MVSHGQPSPATVRHRESTVPLAPRSADTYGGMFGLGRKRRAGDWERATTADLAERAIALRNLAAASLEASRSLVVSPGSMASKGFVDRTLAIKASITEAMPAADAIAEAGQEFEDLAVALGEWQRNAVAELQRELIHHVRQVVASSRQAFDGHDDFLLDIQSVGARLEEVQRCTDIDVVRDTIRSGLQGLQGLVDRQSERLRVQRSAFEEQLCELEGRLAQVESCGNTDYLTNLANRAALTFYLQTTCRKAQLASHRFSVAMIDLDDFKTINDTLGHEAGDRALNTVARHLKEAMGPIAFLGRYGGDEFMVVFPGPAAQLEARLDQIRRKFSACRFSLLDGDAHGTKLSMSAGVVEIERDDSPETIAMRADAAMYSAKRSGKGRIARAA